MNTTLSFLPPRFQLQNENISIATLQVVYLKVKSHKNNAEAVKTLKILSTAARLKQCCLQC